jgi:hypothetical protein
MSKYHCHLSPSIGKFSFDNYNIAILLLLILSIMAPKVKLVNTYDQINEIVLWESNFPLYMFPQTYPFPEFVLKFQANYLPSQRSIASPSGEILFTVNPKIVDQMLQIPQSDSTTSFSVEALNELYPKLTFPQRAQIF